MSPPLLPLPELPADAAVLPDALPPLGMPLCPALLPPAGATPASLPQAPSSQVPKTHASGAPRKSRFTGQLVSGDGNARE